MRLILLFPLVILCCPKNGWIYEESCFVPSQLQKKLFDLINFDQEVDELDKDSMVTKYCSKVCVEMLVRNPDLLMTKILWMIDWVNNIKINAMNALVIYTFTQYKEALDVDPYVSYDVFNFQTIRSFYEHLQLETNLSLERIQEIILPGNSLVKWGENVFNLIELWRIKSRGIKQMLEVKSEDEVLVYLSLVSQTKFYFLL